MSDKRMDGEIRRRVFERDGYTCRYCGSTTGPFHADHVYPYSKGGETSLENMVTSCAACNASKSNKVGVWPKPVGYFTPKRVSVMPYALILFGAIMLSLVVVVISIQYSVPLQKSIYAIGPLLSILVMLLIIWPENKGAK